MEGHMLKPQYSGHLMRRANSLEKTLLLGKVEGRRRRGSRGWDGWMASPTQWTWVWANSGSWRWTGRPGVLQTMVSQRVRHDWTTELNWTDVSVKAFSEVISIWIGDQRKKITLHSVGGYRSIRWELESKWTVEEGWTCTLPSAETSILPCP